jgi:hypothetical protein
MITFTINFAVPPLTDDSVWFANAQAWSNYWNSADVATVTLDPLTTSIYIPTTFASDGYVEMNIGGTNYQLAKFADITALAAKVAALDLAFQTFRQELKDAGLITEAQ